MSTHTFKILLNFKYGILIKHANQILREQINFVQRKEILSQGQGSK